jgi:hypothetical protein
MNDMDFFLYEASFILYVLLHMCPEPNTRTLNPNHLNPRPTTLTVDPQTLPPLAVNPTTTYGGAGISGRRRSAGARRTNRVMTGHGPWCGKRTTMARRLWR